MRIPAEILRTLTRCLPIPGRVIRVWLDRYARYIALPSQAAVVTARMGAGTFEIRDFKEYIQRNIYFLGYYEIRETRLVASMLKPGDIFVDVGANLGWFTVLGARRVGEKGKVYAFEPSTRIFDHLQHNVQLNTLTNVVLEHCAVSDEKGTASLSGISDRNAGIGSIVAHSSEAQEGNLLPPETVETVTLDEYAARIPPGPIRLVKIDVEGAEAKVLKGMQQLIRARRCQNILVEINDERLKQVNQDARSVLATLRGCGYRLFRIALGKPVPFEDSDASGTVNILASLV